LQTTRIEEGSISQNTPWVYQPTARDKSRHVEAYPAELKIQQLQERGTGINAQQVDAIHPDQFGVSAENTA
jgi:hypothetical protein